MAIGLESPGIGLLAFSSIKLAGYSGAAWYAGRFYTRRRSPFVVGAARTTLGFVMGIAYWALIAQVAGDVELAEGGAWFLLGLVPVRFLEWGITLWWFFDRQIKFNRKTVIALGVAVLWSFLLDVPAIVGLISVAGYWIC